MLELLTYWDRLDVDGDAGVFTSTQIMTTSSKASIWLSDFVGDDGTVSVAMEFSDALYVADWNDLDTPITSGEEIQIVDVARLAIYADRTSNDPGDLYLRLEFRDIDGVEPMWYGNPSPIPGGNTTRPTTSPRPRRTNLTLAPSKNPSTRLKLTMATKLGCKCDR